VRSSLRLQLRNTFSHLSCKGLVLGRVRSERVQIDGNIGKRTCKSGACESDRGRQIGAHLRTGNRLQAGDDLLHLDGFFSHAHRHACRLLKRGCDHAATVGRLLCRLVSHHDGVVGLGVSIDGGLQFFAKLRKAGDGFAELGFVLQVCLFATRHGCNHTGKTGGHGAGGGGGTASAGSCRGSGELLDERRNSRAQISNSRLAAHHRGETVFQNERGVEALHLQEPLRSLLQSELGNQSDNLAENRENSVTRRFSFHEFKDAVNRCQFKIGQVH